MQRLHSRRGVQTAEDESGNLGQAALWAGKLNQIVPNMKNKVFFNYIDLEKFLEEADLPQKSDFTMGASLACLSRRPSHWRPVVSVQTGDPMKPSIRKEIKLFNFK